MRFELSSNHHLPCQHKHREIDVRRVFELVDLMPMAEHYSHLLLPFLTIEQLFLVPFLVHLQNEQLIVVSSTSLVRLKFQNPLINTLLCLVNTLTFWFWDS